MGKTAFIFPGQGSQYVGMGKEFYDKYQVVKDMFDVASKAADADLVKICFEENELINQTAYTQIAMFTVEAAILAVLQDAGYKADITAGLSLGEYGALAAAEVMPFETLAMLVRARGIAMQNAYPVGGAMTAVLGMDTSEIERICEATEGIVSVANYNCPGQIVITGEENAVAAASEALKEAGAKRCIPLKVSGPFHSPLLSEAQKKLSEILESLNLSNPKIPYYSNVDATLVTESAPIKELLGKQVVSSVRWQQTMEKMIADGVDTFIEIGPGKTLSGFLGKIDSSVKVYHVDKMADFEKLLEECPA